MPIPGRYTWRRGVCTFNSTQEPFLPANPQRVAVMLCGIGGQGLIFDVAYPETTFNLSFHIPPEVTQIFRYCDLGDVVMGPWFAIGGSLPFPYVEVLEVVGWTGPDTGGP